MVKALNQYRRLFWPSSVSLLATSTVLSVLLVGLTQSTATAETTAATTAHATSSTPKTLTIDIDFGANFIAILINPDPAEKQRSIQTIEKHWQAALIPMTLDVLSFLTPGEIRSKLVSLVSQSVNDPSNPNNSANDWYFWLWNQDIAPVSGYADFKADLFSKIDPRFEHYFRDRQDSARIRLDEIRWGGVKQDGIPPLRNPKMITAQQADYLQDDHVVFGIEINGDARAYPKRILAWHEMFTDTIGGVDIAGVYCTLCGTVIPFKTSLNGTDYQLGTSGFLYRSNKLMYDQATQSLWSTTRGTPVLGPLVDKGIELDFESVVTTTWGEWRKRHSDTTVLSLATGHQRNYDEGVAYARYFATDTVMFNTPFKDTRLANKQEVLALRFPAAPDQQLAIDTEFLNKNPLYASKIGLQNFIVLTDKSGANRVYDPRETRFKHYDQQQNLTDSEGMNWQVDEAWLQASDGSRLPRLPYRRAFWFGWHAAFPETQLIR